MPGARVKRRIRWRLAGLAVPLAAIVAGVAGPGTLLSTTSSAPIGIHPDDATPAVRASGDTRAVELGTRFKVATDGRVIGVRFYKSAKNTGRHMASLWSSNGRRLATGLARHETRAGWQTVTFSKPVRVAAGKRFVASYHTRTGNYSIREGAYARGRLGNDTVKGLAGVYRYGRSGYPNATWHGSDYYVEPLFVASKTGSVRQPEQAPASRPTGSASAKPSAAVSSKPAPSSRPTATVSAEPSASVSSSPATPTTSDAPATSTPPAPVSGGWPNADNTGATGNLTTISGRTITTNGTTLENVMVKGQLTIKADNVTLRNVHVKTDSYYGVLTYGRNTLIEDATIEGKVGTTAGLAAYEKGQFVARRLNVFNTEDGVRLADNCKLYDSFVHDLVGSSEAHFDSVTADMYTGWEIVHNTILNQHSWTAAVWIADPRYEPSAGLLKNNFIAGGGYTIYAGPSTGDGLHVVNNVFSTRYFAKSGYWGIAYKWDGTGNTWSGNVWADGPKAGQPVTP